MALCAAFRIAGVRMRMRSPSFARAAVMANETAPATPFIAKRRIGAEF